MGDGTPEQVTKRCGEAFARLRATKGLSRPQVISRLYRKYPNDSSIEKITESWLERFEAGRLVKVDRPAILALCNAIDATLPELWSILIDSDRNILADDNGVASPAAEAITIFSAYVYDNAEARDMLNAALKDKRVATMSKDAIVQLIADVIAVAMPEIHIEYRSKSIPEAKSSNRETLL